ncbi:MAG: flagellar hook-length control protein FliK [Candidatus Zixiibacteriota bacterium]|nr:MAG: flagellar hook-length control protein FliK [candidate division Zixibacteria bacterium]
MTQMPMNIFDLLMGDVGNLSAGPVTGKSGPVDGAEGLFDTLINSYLASGVNATGENPLGFLVGKAPAADPVRTDSPTIGDEIAAKIGENWPGTVSENVAEFNRQLLSILPRQSGVIRANVHDGLDSKLAELEPGTYEILSAKIENGNIALEVVAKDAPGKAIKVSIPADVLNNPANAQMGGLTTPRVALGTEAYRLESILSQLNLREIHVEASPKSEHLSETARPVNITLVAETTAGEHLLRARLDRSRVRVFEPEVPTSSNGHKASIGRPLTASPVTGAAKVYTPLGVYSNTTANTAVRSNPILTTTNAESWSSLSGTDTNTKTVDGQQTLEPLFGYDAKSADDQSTAGKTEAQNVRFMLPDDVGARLRVNGRAVHIRIEPEHLGPARLSLSMADDKLKARIIVESVPAKAALEQNLDRLINELNKAGIEVDNIEITINNGDAHNQMLGRQPHWRHRVATRLPKPDADSPGPAEIPIVPPPAASAGYAGPAGVNLLA